MSAASRRPGTLRAAAASLLPGRADYAGIARTWRADLLAGLTVGVVALPLALGFGVSSGLSAEAGLVTAIVAGVIAAVFGGSHVQVSGPTGAMVVVLVPIVAAHGPGAVTVVTVMAGALVLVAGLLRLGRAVSYIPWPVVEGFTVGIAVIIFAQQVPMLTSTGPVGSGGHSTNAILAAVESVAAADPTTLAWSTAAAAVVAGCMLVSARAHPLIPGSLLGIAVVTALAAIAPHPLARIGALPASLPLPALPALDPAVVVGLVGPAATVAALAAIESLLSGRVASSLADTGAFDPDRELVGQGLASIGSALFGGMPATGAIARTAVNVRSGARSRLSAICHAALLLAVVAFAGAVVALIPLAALAGVLMTTAVRMVHVATVRSIVRSTRGDAVAFIVTVVVTVSVDLVVAVAIGVVVAGVIAVRDLSRSTAVLREPILGERRADDERIAVLRLDGPLIFASADRVAEAVSDVSDVSVVILRMSRLELVDASGAHVLTEIIRTLERQGITVLLKGVQPGHEEIFRSVGVLDAVRDRAHLFDRLPDAIAHARDHLARERR